MGRVVRISSPNNKDEWVIYMLKVDDIIMVRPTHSLKFSRKWGRIIIINPAEPLPIKVQFTEDGMLYGFTVHELLSGREVAEWDTHTECKVCRKDITGMYSTLCDDCEEMRLYGC